MHDQYMEVRRQVHLLSDFKHVAGFEARALWVEENIQPGHDLHGALKLLVQSIVNLPHHGRPLI